MRRIVGLIIINIFLVVLLGIVTPYFFTKDNLVVMIDNMALEVIALSGYMLLLIGGYFDLSVDGIVSITGVTAGLMMVNGIPWQFAVIAGMSLAVGIGAFNGIVVTKLHVNALIATLTTWWICIGVSVGLTKALSPYGFPKAFQLLGQSRILGFRSFVIYAIIGLVFLSIILHYTKIGSHIYVSGDNRQSAELMGINIMQLGIGLYILVGFLSGIIGLMVASRLNAASPIAVDGMALRVIAAAVIGGANLSGGKGSIIGGLLGLLLMHILGNSIIQLGISPYWQKALLGGILLGAVLTEKINFRMRSVRNV
jgi:ribose transport system permease protein